MGGASLYKNNQKIAIIILIPMILFTFIITVKANSYTVNPVDTIYDYYEFKEKKDITSIKSLLYNKDSLDYIKNQLPYINKINILSAKEYNNQSLINMYLKHNDINPSNVKLYKVIYSATYINEDNYKNGTYESWYFLIQQEDSSWLIDVYDN